MTIHSLIFSVTRLTDFKSFFLANVLTKVAQIFRKFLASSKNYFLSQNCQCYFLGQLLKKLGQLFYFNIWSHCSYSNIIIIRKKLRLKFTKLKTLSGLCLEKNSVLCNRHSMDLWYWKKHSAYCATALLGVASKN